MNTNDKDWIELIAGREKEGFSEKEKKLFSKVRQELLKENLDEFECSEEELARDKEKVMQKWDEHFENETNVIPLSSAKKKRTDFKSFGIPLAMAASVAFVLVAVRDPYPDMSPGFDLDSALAVRGNDQHSIYVLELELKHTSPKKIRKQLKEFFSKNDVQYVFTEIQNGWEVEFIVPPKKLPIIHKIFVEYDLSIDKYGIIHLVIIQE